jgi:hypothetical protein
MAQLSPYWSADTGPATVPDSWGTVGLPLCYVPVQPGISKEDAPWGVRGEATNPEQRDLQRTPTRWSNEAARVAAPPRQRDDDGT